MPKSKNYHELLIESLKDPAEASAYFNAVLEECKSCDDEEAQRLLLLALKNLTEAQGGIPKIVAQTGLKSTELRQMLSHKSTPKLSTVLTLSHALLAKR